MTAGFFRYSALVSQEPSARWSRNAGDSQAFRALVFLAWRIRRNSVASWRLVGFGPSLAAAGVATRAKSVRTARVVLRMQGVSPCRHPAGISESDAGPPDVETQRARTSSTITQSTPASISKASSGG